MDISETMRLGADHVPYTENVLEEYKELILSFSQTSREYRNSRQWHNLKFWASLQKTEGGSPPLVRHYSSLLYIAYVLYVFPLQSKNLQNNVVLHADKYFKAPRLAS